MNHRLVAIIILLLSVNAHASETLTLKFDNIPVLHFLEATYKNILKENYGIDPALSGSTKKISLDVRGIDRPEFQSVVDALLHEAGIGRKKIGDLIYFVPASRADVPYVLPKIEAEKPQELLQMDLPVVGASVLHGATANQITLLDNERIEFYSPRYRSSASLFTLVSQLIGSASMVGDQLLISGDAEKVERVLQILKRADIQRKEVIARALIIEYTDTHNDSSTFHLALDALQSQLKISVGSISRFVNYVQFSDTSINTIVSAIQGDSRFELISAPSLRVKDGKRAKIQVGQDVPVLGESKLDKNGNPVQSITYRSAGVIFDFTPQIYNDRIDLTINQQISNFTDTTSSNIDSPTLFKREVTTEISMNDGGMIVLGGLDERKQNESREGFSFLPSFLRNKQNSSSHSQIIVIIQVATLKKAVDLPGLGRLPDIPACVAGGVSGCDHLQKKKKTEPVAQNKPFCIFSGDCYK